MTPRSLTIAYANERSPRAGLLAETLRGQGHEIVTHDDAAGCLAAPEPDLYLIGRTLADGSAGLELLEALRRTGRAAPIVLVLEKPGFDELRRAVELGASDVVLRPHEAGELGRAIERAAAQRGPKPRLDLTPRSRALERRYPIGESTVGRAAREISAFLVNEGVAGAHRVRIASALAELVDNACRYAYPGGSGEVAVRVELQHSRVRVMVEDSGRGFDVARVKLECIPPALPSRRDARAAPRASSASSLAGLGRVERLCESHELTSGPRGTRAELTFELTPVHFEEDPEHLAETDFLDPSRARSLIASLRKKTDLSGMAPAMALTIGRILGGLDAEVRPPKRR